MENWKCLHCGKLFYSDDEMVRWALWKGGTRVIGAGLPEVRTHCPHCYKSLSEPLFWRH